MSWICFFPLALLFHPLAMQVSVRSLHVNQFACNFFDLLVVLEAMCRSFFWTLMALFDPACLILCLSISLSLSLSCVWVCVGACGCGGRWVVLTMSYYVICAAVRVQWRGPLERGGVVFKSCFCNLLYVFELSWPISFGGIPNNRTVVFVHIFLTHAAEPSAGKTSDLLRNAPQPCWTWPGSAALHQNAPKPPMTWLCTRASPEPSPNLTWLCPKATQTFSRTCGTFSKTLLNMARSLHQCTPELFWAEDPISLRCSGRKKTSPINETWNNILVKHMPLIFLWHWLAHLHSHNLACTWLLQVLVTSSWHNSLTTKCHPFHNFTLMLLRSPSSLMQCIYTLARSMISSDSFCIDNVLEQLLGSFSVNRWSLLIMMYNILLSHCLNIFF